MASGLSADSVRLVGKSSVSDAFHRFGFCESVCSSSKFVFVPESFQGFRLVVMRRLPRLLVIDGELPIDSVRWGTSHLQVMLSVAYAFCA